MGDRRPTVASGLFFVSAIAYAVWAGQERPLSYYMDNGYAIATTITNTIIVFDAKFPGPSPVVWEWRADAPYSGFDSGAQFAVTRFDEVKLRDGGRTMLVTSSGGGWAEIDTETKRIVRSGNAWGCPHSIEKLPDGTIAVARTDPAVGKDGLMLFWTDNNGKLRSKIDSSCSDSNYTQHGVEWDSRRGCLWLEDNDLIGRYAYDSESKSVSLLDYWTIGGNHDLSIADDGTIYVAGPGARFDPDHGDCSKSYLDGRIWYPWQGGNNPPQTRFDVGEWVQIVGSEARSQGKCLTHDPNYGLITSAASGQHNGYGDHAYVMPPNGEPYRVYPICADADMYKIRWVKSTPKAWTEPFSLGKTEVSVSDDGGTVSATTHIDVPDGKPVVLALSLNGIVVTNWTAIGREDFVYSCPVLPGTSNEWSVAARSGDGSGEIHSNAGMFLSRNAESWFRVAFSEDGECPSGSGVTSCSSAVESGGTWSDPDDASFFGAQSRTVLLCTASLREADSVSFEPQASAADADTQIECRIEVVPFDVVPDVPDDSVSGVCFVFDTLGAPVPYALGASGWAKLSGGGWKPCGDVEFRQVWATLRIENDFTSALAPRARYSLDGKTLSTESGDEWMPLPAGTRNISSVGFRGLGEIGDFSGMRSARFVAQPLEPPEPCREGGGLSFAGESGSRKFRIEIDNAMSGGYYAVFASQTLDGVFVTESDSIRASADGALELEIDGEAGSKFAVIVLSPTPIPAGTTLDNYMTSKK